MYVCYRFATPLRQVAEGIIECYHFFLYISTEKEQHIKPMLMSETCLECGEKITGRSDKKFCSDYCRNAYNNRQNRDTNNLMRNVHNRLRRNYRILEELNVKDKTTVPRSKLVRSGFDFTYFTSIYTTQKGATYYFVYDQGYLLLDKGKNCLLVKREQ